MVAISPHLGNALSGRKDGDGLWKCIFMYLKQQRLAEYRQPQDAEELHDLKILLGKPLQVVPAWKVRQPVAEIFVGFLDATIAFRLRRDLGASAKMQEILVAHLAWDHLRNSGIEDVRQNVGILEGEEKEEKGYGALLAVNDKIEITAIGQRRQPLVAQDVLVYIFTQLVIADLGKIDAPHQVGQVSGFLNSKYHVAPEILNMLLFP